MNPTIDFLLNNSNINPSHSPFALGIICGGILGVSVSLTSLISLRRLIIQGVPAGIVSYLGSAVAETFFLSLITYGSLRMIDIWIIVEPSFKLLISIFCFDTILGFLLDKRLKIVSFDNRFDLLKIFLCNVLIVFLNPISISMASALLTSVEIFEFRENNIFLLGIFFGLFFMELFIGFAFLGFNYLWMMNSKKSFRNSLYQSNKIIATFTLTFFILSTIYYHADFYVGTSFTTWSNPLIPSPSANKPHDPIYLYNYYMFYPDKRTIRKFTVPTKRKAQRRGPKHPIIKSIRNYLNPESNLKNRKITISDNYSLGSDQVKNKDSFFLSPVLKLLQEKIQVLFHLKEEKIKFFQDPKRFDFYAESPFLMDKKSKRIQIRELTTDEYKQLVKIREKHFQKIKNSF